MVGSGGVQSHFHVNPTTVLRLCCRLGCDNKQLVKEGLNKMEFSIAGGRSWPNSIVFHIVRNRYGTDIKNKLGLSCAKLKLS